MWFCILAVINMDNFVIYGTLSGVNCAIFWVFRLTFNPSGVTCGQFWYFLGHFQALIAEKFGIFHWKIITNLTRIWMSFSWTGLYCSTNFTTWATDCSKKQAFLTGGGGEITIICNFLHKKLIHNSHPFPHLITEHSDIQHCYNINVCDRSQSKSHCLITNNFVIN